jgi:DNA modification methylase
MINLLHGDCLEKLKELPDCSVDSIVTDPPYGLTSERNGRTEATKGAVMKGFMGLCWDGMVPGVDVWRECLRVLKPGGHLLAFGGARTYHRLACAVEDAGFEIRDQIMWIYGGGFPKSHNLKGDWQGWGTALKPAHEPIVVARKPFKGTVANNVLEYGTGALNIDDCRVPGEPPHHNYGRTSGNKSFVGASDTPFNTPDLGRWPANLIHDGSDEVVALFPQAPGQIADISNNSESRKNQNCYGSMVRGRSGEPSADSGNEGAVGFKMKPGTRRLDSGSAARFFYCAKASRKDRHEGVDDPGPQFKHGATLRHVENAETKGNNHPTVKPTELMRYLCRLVTASGGVVLDPFMGSGSTGKAAILEGFRFIGIELSQEYINIAEARINHAIATREAA